MMEAEIMDGGDGAKEVVGEDDGNNQRGRDPLLQPPVPILMEAETMDGAREVQLDLEGKDEGDIRCDPFLQPPILKAFFEVLPLEDLASCRLVSKLWYNESLSTWRSNITINLQGLELLEGIISKQGDISERTTMLGEFLYRWKAGEWEWGSSPFKQFKLHHWNLKFEDHQRFLELVGGHVTTLTLNWCMSGGWDNFQKIIHQALPNLQFLKIEDYCDGFRGVHRLSTSTQEILAYEEPAFGLHGLQSLSLSSLDLPNNYCFQWLMMDVLSFFHKLKSLHMRAPDRVQYQNLLEAIRLIRAQDKTKLPLKNFDVPFYFNYSKSGSGPSTASSNEILKLQDQLNLPLQNLRIVFRGDKDLDPDLNHADVFRDILKFHSSTSTLECLIIRGDDPSQLCKSFPFGVCLENLEKLVVPSHFFDNLNYLRTTPNLRVLEIKPHVNRVFTLSQSESDNLFSNSGPLEVGDWTLPALKELIFGVPLSVCNLKKLMKWMPNVERFVVGDLDDVKFAMVCNNWKNLEILEDWGYELSDEGIIGTGNVHEAGGDKGTQSVPNITKLKNLTSFWTRSTRLTSASVHGGFLQLANLKKLSWSIYNHYEVLDEEAKAALESRKITSAPTRNWVLNCVVT